MSLLQLQITRLSNESYLDGQVPKKKNSYIYICIYYIYYLLHESECDMVKYFMNKLMYFQEPEASENIARE